MNFSELIYKIIEFFFDDLIHLIYLTLFLLIINNGLLTFYYKIKNFITKIIINYRNKIKLNYGKNKDKTVKR